MNSRFHHEFNRGLHTKNMDPLPARFESSPNLLAKIGRRMVRLIPAGIEVLAGLEMGGIAVVTMLSHYSGRASRAFRGRA
jgi:orotate phosphoribosyltransferase